MVSIRERQPHGLHEAMKVRGRVVTEGLRVESLHDVELFEKGDGAAVGRLGYDRVAR
jgi:hypothetical protein